MQVDVALDLVDKMCEAGFTLSTEVLQSILHICEETYEYILVWHILLTTAPLFFFAMYLSLFPTYIIKFCPYTI